MSNAVSLFMCGPTTLTLELRACWRPPHVAVQRGVEDRTGNRDGGERVPLFEDFENCVGTYLKVLRFSEPTTPDGFLVLYLRPNGRFLFAGYWSGYERSAAAGRWVRQGVEVRLDGRGRVATDAIPGPEGRRFERIFAIQDTNHTPSLIASNALAEWSLLNWTGPLAYVGQHTIIDPDGRWLPGSMPVVDAWIEQVLGA